MKQTLLIVDRQEFCQQKFKAKANPPCYPWASRTEFRAGPEYRYGRLDVSERTPDADMLFVDENLVPGNAGKRAAHKLARLWAHLTLSGEHADNPRPVTIMDLIDEQRRRLELHQTLREKDNPPRFTEGQEVHVIGNDDGVPLGCRGHIEKVEPHADFLAYTVVLKGPIYRQERRNAFRVPVDGTDEVQAELHLSSQSAPLAGRVRDLSMTGCWLELDPDTQTAEDLESELKKGFTIALSMSSRRGATRNQAEVAWTAQSDTGALSAGVYWSHPEPEFTKQVRRFVMSKERELIKRRTRS